MPGEHERGEERKSVLLDSSVEHEAHPENKAQDAGQLVEKIREEGDAEGGGVVGAVKAYLHHEDREIGGEYEAREDPDAVPSSKATSNEQMPRGHSVDELRGRRG